MAAKINQKLTDAFSLMAQFAPLLAAGEGCEVPAPVATKSRKPRERREKHPLDVARTLAWLTDVKRCCAENDKPLPSAKWLKSLEWKSEQDAIDIPNFDRFEKGKEIPDSGTIELIDACLEFAIPTPPKGPSKPPSKEPAKTRPSGNPVSCRDTFEVGPGGIPVWHLLGVAPDLDYCSGLLDLWFVHAHCGLDLEASHEEKTRAARTYFGPKVSALLTHFIGERSNVADRKNYIINYLAYDEGRAENVAFRHIKEGGKYPSISDFVLILAAAHLAEKRKECRSITRYLLDAAILCAPKTFEKYGCGEHVGKTLARRRKITDASLIAKIDFIREAKWLGNTDLRAKMPAYVDLLEAAPLFEPGSAAPREQVIAFISDLYEAARKSENL